MQLAILKQGIEILSIFAQKKCMGCKILLVANVTRKKLPNFYKSCPLKK